MDVAIAPSPFVDVFLACDRIVKPGGMVNSVHSPITDAKVNYGDMCAKMLAYGLLLLREDGAIDITLTEKKVLFVKSHFVAITKKKDATALEPPAPYLLECVVSGKGAYDTVRQLIADEMTNPWGFVAGLAVDKAQELGLVSEKKAGLGGAFGKFATGIPKLDVASDKSAEIEARISSCAHRWNAFAQAEPELAEQLVKDCYSGIQSRTRQDLPSND